MAASSKRIRYSTNLPRNIYGSWRSRSSMKKTIRPTVALPKMATRSGASSRRYFGLTTLIRREKSCQVSQREKGRDATRLASGADRRWAPRSDLLRLTPVCMGVRWHVYVWSFRNGRCCAGHLTERSTTEVAETSTCMDRGTFRLAQRSRPEEEPVPSGGDRAGFGSTRIAGETRQSRFVKGNPPQRR